MSSINKEPNSNTTDLDSGNEGSGVFSVARSNTTPPFEKQKSILNEMAEFVEIFVVFPQMFSTISLPVNIFPNNGVESFTAINLGVGAAKDIYFEWDQNNLSL